MAAATADAAAERIVELRMGGNEVLSSILIKIFFSRLTKFFPFAAKNPYICRKLCGE